MVKSEFSKRNPFERNKRKKEKNTVWGMIKEPEKLSIFIVVTMVVYKKKLFSFLLF